MFLPFIDINCQGRISKGAKSEKGENCARLQWKSFFLFDERLVSVGKRLERKAGEK